MSLSSICKSVCVCVLIVAGMFPAFAVPFQRVANTTLTNVPVVPGGFGYTFTNAFPFPGMVFTNPVCLATPPGETNRLFICEKSGRIVVITNLASPTRAIFLDMTARVTTTLSSTEERGLLGLEFHPGYATNGYFYVFYTGTTNTTSSGGGNGLHDILARYQVSAGNSNQANAASHVPLIVQFDQANNHNGGDIHFGPDGYLYVSLGDEGNSNDSLNNSQRITNDFFSAMLRIDVDKRPGNLTPNPHHAVTTNYLVPADNPYIGATSFNGISISPTNVRTEFWAVGLRNPWRWNFDFESGRLYLGDVGQGAREEIDLIERGGNYGWAFTEGFTNGPNIAAGGFVHSPPLFDYPRSDGFAITGGRVYRGVNISQLVGAYVYADYGSGNIWALRHTGTNVTQNQLLFTDPLTSGTAGISAFGVDPRNGDLLYCDVQNATDAVIKRIVYNATFTGQSIPATLSNTGVFTNLSTLAVAPGIVPYDLNTPFWSDNAVKSRWFSIPATNQDMTFNPTGNWTFPSGTIWIKHFELEITNGVPASRRRLETRLLVSNTNGGYGVTYRWTTPPTNALLVSETGLDEVITNYTSGGAVAGTQLWRYPSRSECLVCHTSTGGFGLGFNTAQLNRDFNYGLETTNQLQALASAGYFSNSVANHHLLPALAHATNAAVSLEYRVRSYLAANCSGCHQPGGTAQARWDARITTPTPQNGIINGDLLNTYGSSSNRVISPGSLAGSILFQRVANLGNGHMPPIATSVVNTEAVNLLAAWITNELASYVSFASWQSNYFGSTNSASAAHLADPDADGSKNYLEYLTQTVPTNAASAWRISINRTSGVAQVTFPQIANRGFEVQTSTNLLNTNAWTPLNTAANAPFFSVSNRTATVPDTISPGGPMHYRVRVFEP